jgi:hypothetical protein
MESKLHSLQQGRKKKKQIAEATSAPFSLDFSLQGFPSIATKFIAATIFHCNKTQYCHQIPICGNKPQILPQVNFDVIVPYSVAIGPTYYNELHGRCNMLALS